MNHFALHDAAIFTVDPHNRVIPRGTLIVEDGRISAVGPSDEVIIPPGMPVIDASGHALLPGLIDAHSHSSLMRGVTENMQLMDWLPWYQLEHRALTEEYAFHSARLCYLEALKSGTTCVMDMYRFMARCADAAGEIGLRVNLAPYVADAPGKDFFATRAENRALIHSHHGAQNGRIQVWMGLEHLFYCTPDAYREALQCQADYGVGIHTHASEQKEEDDAVKAEFGRRSIAQLDHYGILGERTLLAHCVWLTDEEINNVFSRFKEIGDKKKFVYDDDLSALVDGQMTKVPETWVMEYLNVTSGNHTVPTATVRLKKASTGRSKKETVLEDAGVGDGPVDAALKAIDRLTETRGRLKDYAIRAVSQGKDALGEVSVKVDFGDGDLVTGKGASTDVIEASAKAYLNAVNRHLNTGRRKKKPRKTNGQP